MTGNAGIRRTFGYRVRYGYGMDLSFSSLGKIRSGNPANANLGPCTGVEFIGSTTASLPRGGGYLPFSQLLASCSPRFGSLQLTWEGGLS